MLLSGENNPDGGKSCWGSGFLPTTHQGVEFRSSGEPVLFVSNPEGVESDTRARSIAAINDLNRSTRPDVRDPEIQTRIAAYELACRMQTSVPELTELSKEPASIHELYGTEPGRASLRTTACSRAAWWSASALRPALPSRLGHARRVVRRGHRRKLAPVPQTDRIDLRPADRSQTAWSARRHAGRRGGGSAAPMNEARNGSKFLGRDHHPRAFTMWLAGGGIKPGITIGRTDEPGLQRRRDPVDVHDLHSDDAG